MRKSPWVAAMSAATMIMASGLSAVAADDATDEMLKKDTVICMKNDMGGEAVTAVVSESFYNRSSNARTVEVKDGKIVCLRYRKAKQVQPFFVAGSELSEDGALLNGAQSAECRKTKATFAKYYVLTRDEDGNKRCQIDSSRNKEQIKSMAKKASPINAQ